MKRTHRILESSLSVDLHLSSLDMQSKRFTERESELAKQSSVENV